MPALRHSEWFALSVMVAVVAPVLATAPAQGTQPSPGGDHRPGAFIEVSPDTVRAGQEVRIVASCDEKVDSAKARSRAFDEVDLLPEPGSTLLSGVAFVPAGTAPDTYPVNLRCPNAMVASTDLHVISGVRPTVGPATGGGGTARGDGPADDGVASLALLAAGLTALVLGAALLAHRRRPAGRRTAGGPAAGGSPAQAHPEGGRPAGGRPA